MLGSYPERLWIARVVVTISEGRNRDGVNFTLEESQITRNDSVRNELNGNEVMMPRAITQSQLYVPLAKSAPLVMFASFVNDMSQVLVLSPQSGFAHIVAGSPTIFVANKSLSRTSSGDSIRSRPTACPASEDTAPVKSCTWATPSPNSPVKPASTKCLRSLYPFRELSSTPRREVSRLANSRASWSHLSSFGAYSARTLYPISDG